MKPAPPSAGQRPLDFGLIRRLYAYTAPHARLRNRLLFFVLLRAVQLPLVTWATASVISGPIARHDFPGTVHGVLGLLCLVAVTESCFVFRARYALELGESVVQDLRRDIYARLLAMPIGYFRRTQVGKLIGRITSDVDVVRIGVQDVAFVSTVQLGNLVVSAVLMLVYDALLFLIVLVMAPVLWTIVRYFRVGLSRAYRAQQESFSRVTATLAESVGGIREIQGFVRQDVNGELFEELIRDHSRYNYGAAKQSAVFQPLLELNGQVFLAILLVVGGYQALGHHVPLDAVIQFLFLSNAFFHAIPLLGTQYNQALTAMAGAERVFSLLDRQPEWQDAPDAKPLPAIRGHVEFRDVSFEYEPGRTVLDRLSFGVEPGRTLALVGHTGGGKTTIMNLVAKLYPATRGAVFVDGHDLAGVTAESLHRQIASVTQENFLFTGSVLENIRFGKPGASDVEVREAARSLDVLDLIEALPRGFDTEVGEGGGGLSLGQRQIVCFVRAMLAEPRIVLLDEATSSVDVVTEARIQTALARLLEERTSFVVAHRLSTIRHADEVLILEHGRIAERGTHRELLLKGGAYSDLYRQFASLVDAES
ncbi:MAG TPA: ABC transporter ATP-binding protein [Polyangiaceae bacterium]